MKDIFINKYDHFEILLFVAGIISTFQAVTFHGITLFSWFLLALLALGYLEKHGKIRIDFSEVKVILIGLVIATMTITEIITVYLNTYPGWTGRSVKNYLLMAAVFLLYFILREEKKYSDIYIKGIMISGVINYIACFIEYIAYKTSGIDLTDKYLHVETRLRYGDPMITGLTTNPAMLIPVILITLCFSGNIAAKVMALATALIINSSTALICVAIYFFIYALVKLRRYADLGWNFNKVAFTVIAVGLIVFLIFEPLREMVKTVYGYVILRLSQASTGVGENLDGMSERAHFRYYWSLPYIFDHINIVRILFGFGKNCSGIPFSELYNQYRGELWIPETDPIATLYDVGIIGFLAMYALLTKLFADFCKKGLFYGIFMACMIIGGIFYGFQMTWVLMVELMICESIPILQSGDSETH